MMGEALKKEDKKTIDDYLLSSEQVSGGQYPSDEIYEIQIEGQVIGPFWQEDLKDFLSDAGLYETDTTVRNFGEEDWQNIFEHPLFQRRRPSLVSTDEINSTNDTYFILKDGQKLGPYTKSELQLKVEDHEVLLNDYVSIDEGQSWGKLHQVDGFNRRKHGNQNLPTTPEGHVFNNSMYDADKALAKAEVESAQKDALIGLAYIGHLNEGKKKVHIDVTKAKAEISANEKAQESQESEGQRNNLLTGLAALGIFIIIFAGYNMFSSSPSERNRDLPTKKAKRVSKEEFTNAGNAKKISNKKRQAKKVQARRPARKKNLNIVTNRQITRGDTSIKKAEFLKKKKLNDGVIEQVDIPQEMIFDDATEAVELDPIRQRVSKDIIDPELEDQYEEDIPFEELEDLSNGLGPIDEDGNPIDDEQYIE